MKKKIEIIRTFSLGNSELAAHNGGKSVLLSSVLLVIVMILLKTVNNQDHSLTVFLRFIHKKFICLFYHMGVTRRNNT